MANDRRRENGNFGYLFLLIAVTTIGCSLSTTAPKGLSNHVLMSDDHGFILTSTESGCSGGMHGACNLKFSDAPEDKQQEHLHNLVTNVLRFRYDVNDQKSRESCRRIGVQDYEMKPYGVVATEPRRVMLIVHGGLNSQQGALKRARDLHLRILCTGIYPIFVIWPSSLFDSYLDHLFHIRQGKHISSFFDPRGYPFAPVYLATDLARSLARFPAAFGTLVQNDFEASIFYEEKDLHSLANNLRKAPTGFDLSESTSSRGLTFRSLYDGLSYLLTLPTKIVLSPFVDAMGTSAWNTMRRRTQTLSRTQEEYEIKTPRAQQANSSIPYICALNCVGRNASSWAGALYRLVEALDYVTHRDSTSPERDPGLSNLEAYKELKREADLNKVRFDFILVGHSMGTIVLNEVLSAFDDLPVSSIVYMAAACSIKDYEETVWPFLQHDQRRKFYTLMLHDKAEAQDKSFLPIPMLRLDPGPRGSLLVWIDSFLAEPETLRDRTLGRYTNFVPSLHNVPDDIRLRINAKVFKDDEEFHPQHHTGFMKSLKFWREECWDPNQEAGWACWQHPDTPDDPTPGIFD